MSVSVVIPAYNAQNFIRKALVSVLEQTVEVDEIIVVDDGSSDETSQIVAAYAPRVRLLQQQNQGPSRARNFGVESATSEWVAFLDADDAWVPQKIEKQLNALQAHPESVLCYTGLRNLLPDGLEAIRDAFPVSKLRDQLRLENPGITPSSVVVRRSTYFSCGGFTSNFKGSEDWDLWSRLIDSGPFCNVNEPLTLYQVSNTGLSSNAEHMFREAKSLLDLRLLLGLKGMRRALWRQRILSYQSYKAALTARASQQTALEVGFILKSFLYWPSPFWNPDRLKFLAVATRNFASGPHT